MLYATPRLPAEQVEDPEHDNCPQNTCMKTQKHTNNPPGLLGRNTQRGARDEGVNKSIHLSVRSPPDVMNDLQRRQPVNCFVCVAPITASHTSPNENE